MNQAGSEPSDSLSCSGEDCPSPEIDGKADLCPVSRTTGLRVGLITLKALLKGDALRRLEGKAYRFCPDPECDVVYFDREADSSFDKSDLEVRVGQKESEGPIPVCYCFGFTLEDLRRDLTTRGETEIPVVIANEIKAGHCACEVKNPQGSCCLGNVSRAIQRVRDDLVERTGIE